MGVPLTSLTQRPVVGDTFSVGGDDTQKGNSWFFGTIAQWDLNASDDCFKTNFIFVVKKAFAFLDSIGVGDLLFQASGFERELVKCERYQTGLERNREAREKVVNAFGGSDVCQRIPTIAMDAVDMRDYLKLSDRYFQGGQWVVQGEDPAGRKFALLRLTDRLGNLHIATAHQRYRETCIDGTGSFGDGSLWTLNFEADNHLGVNPNTEHVAEFIEKIRTLRHEEFSIAPKP